MKVFLDTNILLDYVDNREQREHAKRIIDEGVKGNIQLVASYLTYANMAFILRHRPREEKYKLLRLARRGGNCLYANRRTTGLCTKPRGQGL